MKQRIVIFSIDEIVIDVNAIAQSINDACHRDKTRYRVSGICQNHDSVLVSLEETNSQNGLKYVLVPFSGTSTDAIKADIFTRWSSGFSTKGLIRLSESYLGLFESNEINQVPELFEHIYKKI